MIEVVASRLYLAREDVIGKAEFKANSVVIDLSASSKVAAAAAHDNAIYLRWNIGDDVEERQFEALVRFAAGMMKSPRQCVVLVGHKDTIDVCAACVLREYLGCRPEIAISILREARPKCLNKPDLVETVCNYKIS
jgi:predicted RNase H-like nuclease